MRAATVKVELVCLPREADHGSRPTEAEMRRAVEEAVRDLPFDVSVEDGNGSAWRVKSATAVDAAVSNA